MKLTVHCPAMGLSALVWFLLLATAPLSTVWGEVVSNFNTCRNFFKDDTPPEGFEGMQNLVSICQKYNNNYHFATLYRTDLRIPVYSAYKYQSPQVDKKDQRPKIWFYEPQIDDAQQDTNMLECLKKKSDKQAVMEDYKNQDFDRGHLYPFSFNAQDSAVASCTLTNAIPQTNKENNVWANGAEKIIKILAKRCCESGRTVHLVTGSAKYSNNKVNNKVVIPGMIWTAVCCNLSQNRIQQSLKRKMGNPIEFDFSIAFKKDRNTQVVHLSVEELENELKSPNQQAGSVKIFNKCKRDGNGQTKIEEMLQNLSKEQDDNKKKKGGVSGK